MARFDVYEYKSNSAPLLIEVQAELLADLSTCVVLPIVPEDRAKKEALPKLKPIIEVNGTRYILMTTDIGVLARKSLGDVVANVEDDYRQEITDALDFLFQGF
ncbi:MAG: CcdB family protein [Alphaproteobacteria bacterium]|nr:CcdB family protein [Alphaproteobacteria bacterium]